MRANFSDRSGTITSGGTAQFAVAENRGRSSLFIQNIDTSITEAIWVRLDGGVAVVNGAGSVRLDPGAYLEAEEAGGGFVPVAAISVIAATTGHKFTIYEA